MLAELSFAKNYLNVLLCDLPKTNLNALFKVLLILDSIVLQWNIHIKGEVRKLELQRIP